MELIEDCIHSKRDEWLEKSQPNSMDGWKIATTSPFFELFPHTQPEDSKEDHSDHLLPSLLFLFPSNLSSETFLRVETFLSITEVDHRLRNQRYQSDCRKYNADRKPRHRLPEAELGLEEEVAVVEEHVELEVEEEQEQRLGL